jgi:hypothetical protein
MSVLLFLLLQLLSGGSVDGAAYLAEGKADIAFNWSGGHNSCQQATKLHAGQERSSCYPCQQCSVGCTKGWLTTCKTHCSNAALLMCLLGQLQDLHGGLEWLRGKQCVLRPQQVLALHS